MAASTLLSRSGTPADDFFRFPTGSETRRKRGRNKSVSWPCNEMLCEVCLFLAEDAPSLVGRNWLGSKTNNNVVSLGKRARHVASSAYLVVRQPEINPKMNTSTRPGIQWHHPQQFVLDDSWLVASGDESTEVSVENQKQISLLEVFYPRYASIPDSPAEPHEGCCINSDHTHVPLVPLEEVEVVNEEAVLEETYGAEASVELNTSHDSAVQRDIIGSKADPENGEQGHVIGIADPGIAAVAAAACMAVKALGESDLVDQALLVELLRNPSLIKSLTSINHTPSCNGQNHMSSSKASIPDLWSYSNNTSPVSVLTSWGEDTAKQCSGSSTPLSETTGTSIVKHPTHRNFTMGAVASSGNAPNSLLFLSTSPLHQEQTNSDLQASSLDQDGRCSSEAGTLLHQPSQTSMLNLHLVQAVSAPMHSRPVSYNKASLRATRGVDKLPIGRRVGQDNKTNRLQRKCAIVNDPLKMEARNRRLCVYFNTPKGCRKGRSCAFLHQSLNPEMNTVAK